MGYQGKIFFDTLSYEYPVKRIAMMEIQFEQSQ